jgi:hypothetical protein
METNEQPKTDTATPAKPIDDKPAGTKTIESVLKRNREKAVMPESEVPPIVATEETPKPDGKAKPKKESPKKPDEPNFKKENETLKTQLSDLQKKLEEAGKPNDEVASLAEISKLMKEGKTFEAFSKLAGDPEKMEAILQEYVKGEWNDPVATLRRELAEKDRKIAEDEEKRKTEEKTAASKRAEEDSDRYVAGVLKKNADKFKLANKHEKNRQEATKAAGLLSLDILKRDGFTIDDVEQGKVTAEQAEAAVCEAFEAIEAEWRERFAEEKQEKNEQDNRAKSRDNSDDDDASPPPRAGIKIAPKGKPWDIEVIKARNRQAARE